MTINLAEESLLQKFAMMQKRVEGLLSGRTHQRGLLLRVRLLPELSVQSLACPWQLARREKIFQVRIRQYQDSVFVRPEGDRRSVWPLDHIGGEEVGHARHIVVCTDGQHQANVVRILRPVGREQRQTSGKAHAHYA